MTISANRTTTCIMNYLTKLGFCLFFASIFFACEFNDPKDVGQGLNPLTGNFGIIYTDTLTLQTSTLLVDSVVTTAGSNLLAGEYTDPIQGKVTARSFFQVRYDSRFDLGANVRIDSVRFIFFRDSVNASPVNHTLKLYRLTADIDGSRNYLSNEQISYNPTPVGSYSFVRSATKVGKIDTIRMPVDVSVGQDLIRAYSTTLTPVDFIKTFKGFSLGTEGPGSGISSFRTTNGSGASSAGIAIYFRNGTDTTKKAIFFTAPNLYNNGVTTMFNQVKNDRSGTPMSGLQKMYDSLASASTNEQTYIQSGTGLKTKVVIPYFSKLFQNRNIIINDAKLIIDPISGSPFAASQALPAQLALYEVTKAGRLPVISSTSGTRTLYFYVPWTSYLESVNASLGENGILRKTTTFKDGKYIFNITDYLQRLVINSQLAADQQLPDKGLVIAVPSGSPANGTPFGSNEVSVRGLVLGSQKNAAKPMKLVVYYTYVNAD